MKLIEKLLEARRRRLAAQDLRALGPEVLGDIGVEPGRIHETVSGMLAARKAAEGRSSERQSRREAASVWPDGAAAAPCRP